MRIGYARVSTRDQHPHAQADALTGASCERIFTDTASGKLARRPELDQALRTLRAGDQLVVTKLDRLGRSLEHLIELSNQLQTRAGSTWWCSTRVSTPPPPSGGCSSRSSARSPSSNTPSCPNARWTGSRPRGRGAGPVGRSRSWGTRQARLAREMYEAGELTVAQIAAEFGVTRTTIYRHLDRLDQLDAADK